MAKDILITPADGDIVFDNSSGAECGAITQNGNDLVISNAVGDILLGDGASDIYIGDGTNNVDILFEQSGNIKAEDGSNGVTLTIGSGDTTLVLESPTLNTPALAGASTINNSLTLTTTNSKIIFDYEAAQTGEYTNEVPLLQIDRSGTPITILSRVSSVGAIVLGADDTVHIAAGDTKSVIKANLNLSGENVILSSESGFAAYGFPANGVTWANRNEFRFRSDSGTASDNGLYIGDGGNTQFIDLSRNLTVGTVGSGAIISTGTITAVGSFIIGNADMSEVDLEKLDGITNGAGAANKALVLDANTDIASGVRHITISGELDAATLDISGDADIDGTLNADGLDIDGNADISGNLTVGANLISSDGAQDAYYINANNKVYAPNTTNQWHSAAPFGALWHDLTGFNRNYTTTQTTSTDGTNFSSETLELGLFAQQDKTAYNVIENNERAFRLQWHNVAYNVARYIRIASGYSSPAPTCSVLIETSADGTNWSTIHTSSGHTFSASAKYYWVESYIGNGGHAYVRLTIDKGNTDSKVVRLTSVQMLTQRLGDQGKGGEDNFPYVWDKNKNITVQGELAATSLDISGDVDVDGTLEADVITLDGTALGSLYSPIAGGTGIVTTGVLNAGSINTSFGNINNGGSTITTTGLITGGSLDIDDVVINGANIGHTNDTDLIVLANGAATVNGDLSVTGDLNITGDINTVSVTDLDVTDKTITIAKGAANSAAADGAGIVVDGAAASLLYDHTGTQWEFNKPLEVTGTVTSTGVITGTGFTAGNAVIAESELELLDGLTAGTAIASKVVTTDSAKDTSGQRNLTITGVLQAEHLRSTDDLVVDDDASVGGNLTVTDFIQGASPLTRLRNMTALPGGYVEPDTFNFRFDESATAYAGEPAGIGGTLGQTTGNAISAGNLKRLFTYTANYINLNTHKDGSNNVVIELTNIAVSNSANTSWKPYVFFHSAASNVATMKIELRDGDDNWETVADDIDCIDFYIFDGFYTLSPGILKGAKFTFTNISGNSYLRMIGVIGKTHASYQWNLLKSGGDMFGNVNWADSYKAQFGTGDDLSIYHDGSNSYINEGGAGDLYIQTNGTNMFLRNSANGDSFVAMNTGTRNVQLRHANSTKLETVAGGIEVTGEVQGDTLDIDGAADIAGALVVSAGAVSITGDGSNATVMTESGDGQFLIDTVLDMTLDFGGGDLILSDDGNIFGTISSASGLQIRSRVGDADMLFRGVNGSTEFTALTLDMSEGGNATFAGDATVTGKLVMGSTDALTNAGLLSVANQSNITGVGIISSGTWQGTTIKTTYIADANITMDKLANVATDTIIGRTASGTGVPKAMSATEVRAILGVENNSTADQTKGDIEGLAIQTTGELTSGTIAAGFGTINTGASTITTTGTVATGALTVGGDFIVNGDNITFQSDQADDPLVTIKNTHNSTDGMARLQFVKDRGAAPADLTNVAEITFVGENSNQAAQQYGRIFSEIITDTAGSEVGAVRIGAATKDGENQYGIQILGTTTEDRIDVLIATDSSSVTTIAGTLTMGSDASVINFGVNNEVTLTHVHNTGLLLNGAMKIQFNDASQFIHASSNAILELGATDEIGLTATLVDMDANLDVSGTALITGVLTVASKIVHADDTNNFIAFGTDTQTFTTGAGSRMNISDSGLQIGGGARVTTIENNDSLGTSDTKLATQGNIKAYVDANAGGTPAADDITAGDAAVTVGTTSGNVTIDSNAGAVSIDGHTGVTIASSNSGDITLDSAADINLDAAGNDINIKFGGTHVLSITDSSSNVIIKPIVDAKDIIFQQRDGTAVLTIEDNGTANIPVGKLALGGTAVTPTAAEINTLKDFTGDKDDLIYAKDLKATGVTATEFNLLDGNTARGTVAIANGDGFLTNDAGVMRMTKVETLATYIIGRTPDSAEATSEGDEAVAAVKGLVALATNDEAILGNDSTKAITARGAAALVTSKKVTQLTAPTSAFAMNSQKITGVANPTANQDAATKAYVDAQGGQLVVLGSASGFINRTAAQFASDGTDQVYVGSNNYGWNDARDWATQMVDIGTPILNQNDQMCGIICPISVSQVTIKSQVRMNSANGNMMVKVYKMNRATAVATNNLALTLIASGASNTMNGRFTTIDIVGTTAVAAGQLIIVGFGKTDGGNGQKPRFNFTLTGTIA